jgi:hypothetical protein
MNASEEAARQLRAALAIAASSAAVTASPAGGAGAPASRRTSVRMSKALSVGAGAPALSPADYASVFSVAGTVAAEGAGVERWRDEVAELGCKACWIVSDWSSYADFAERDWGGAAGGASDGMASGRAGISVLAAWAAPGLCARATWGLSTSPSSRCGRSGSAMRSDTWTSAGAGAGAAAGAAAGAGVGAGGLSEHVLFTAARGPYFG